MALAVDLAESRAPMTLGHLVDQWSATKRGHYRRPLDRHVLPVLGNVPLDRIARPDIIRVLEAMRSEAQLSASTINKILATLKRVLEFGVRCGCLPHNPVLGVRPLPQPAA